MTGACVFSATLRFGADAPDNHVRPVPTVGLDLRLVGRRM
jgi:hypothetical protein